MPVNPCGCGAKSYDECLRDCEAECPFDLGEIPFFEAEQLDEDSLDFSDTIREHLSNSGMSEDLIAALMEDFSC
jgi:hypothetical protein